MYPPTDTAPPHAPVPCPLAGAVMRSLVVHMHLLPASTTVHHPVTMRGMHLNSAQDLRLTTGDARSLSRRYAQGELVRVRKGVYARKEEWVSLAPWERYLQTVRAVDLELPGSAFCLNSAIAVWNLDLLAVPGCVHLSGASRGHRPEATHHFRGVQQVRSHRHRTHQRLRRSQASWPPCRSGARRASGNPPARDRSRSHRDGKLRGRSSADGPRN